MEAFFTFGFQFFSILPHIRKAWVFLSVSHSKWKCSGTHVKRTVWEIGIHTFPKVWVLSWYLMVYFIPWQMHGYSHQYPIACYMHQNPFYGESLEIDSLNFPKLWFFSIRFPPYGVLYLMRNAWVFLSISHSIGKRNKTYRMGEIWDTYIPWTHILRYHGLVV